MGKIRIYIVASIDGYIACPWEDIGWLNEFFNSSQSDYGYKAIFNSSDIVFMDEIVYNEILSMDIIWPYQNKETYVVSSSIRKSKENIRFVTDGIPELLSELKQRNCKNIWLIGGEVISSLFDFLDEIQLVYIPIIHGTDKQLFPKNLKSSQWILVENKSYENGVLQVKYQVKK